MKPLILTDIDDCCLNWIAGFRMYASRVLGREITGLPQSWEMAEWLGLHTDPLFKGKDLPAISAGLVSEFNHGEWEFGCLPPVANAEKFLPSLALDFDIVAITCCSIAPATVALRKANLYHIFGPIFKEVICLPLGTNKTEKLSLFKNHKVHAWVEDKYEAAMHGHALGYPSFLIHQDHNKKHRDDNPNGPLNYVQDWTAISNLI